MPSKSLTCKSSANSTAAKLASALIASLLLFLFSACDSQVAEKAASPYRAGPTSATMVQKQNNLDSQIGKISTLVNHIVHETEVITSKVNDPSFSVFTIFNVLKEINDSAAAQMADVGPTNLLVEGVFQIPYGQLSNDCQQFKYQVIPNGDLRSGTITYALKTCLRGDAFTPVLIAHFDQNQMSLEFLQSNLQAVVPDPLISFQSGNWDFNGQLKELNCKNLIFGQPRGLKVIASLTISPLSETKLIEFDAHAIDIKFGNEIWWVKASMDPTGKTSETSGDGSEQ